MRLLAPRFTSRAEMKEAMPYAAYREWMELYTVDPWHGDRDDLRAVFLAHAIAAPHTKGGKMPTPSEFLYAFTNRKATSQEALKAKVMAMPGWTHTTAPAKDKT